MRHEATGSRASGAGAQAASGARRVPDEFNLLIGQALRFLPGAAWRNRQDEDARAKLREAVRAADMAGAEQWPDRAAQLWRAAGDVSDGTAECIERGMINRALDAVFPAPVQAWQRRRDLGGGDFGND